jgi:hypothetical protein
MDLKLVYRCLHWEETDGFEVRVPVFAQGGTDGFEVRVPVLALGGDRWI